MTKGRKYHEMGSRQKKQATQKKRPPSSESGCFSFHKYEKIYFALDG